MEDLKLPLSDQKLEKRLHKLVKSDILARGDSNFHYRALGDPVFDMVFRRFYEPEIARAGLAPVEKEIEKTLTQAKKRVACYRGLAAEYRVMYQLDQAAQKGAALADIVYNPNPRCSLGGFVTIKKLSFQIDQESSVEVDLFAESENPAESDFVIEVKDWKDSLSQDRLDTFLREKNLLETVLKKTTGFIFYSEKGFSEKQKTFLRQHDIMFSDSEKLVSWRK